MTKKALVNALVGIASRCEQRKAYALRSLIGDARALEMHAADEERRIRFDEFVALYAASSSGSTSSG